MTSWFVGPILDAWVVPVADHVLASVPRGSPRTEAGTEVASLGCEYELRPRLEQTLLPSGLPSDDQLGGVSGPATPKQRFVVEH